MRISIHQPNFLPWMGLFNRIALSNKFIFFDHVQAMGGKSWLSRNKILVSGKDYWITMPVRKSGRLGQSINEVEINYDVNFKKKHLKTFEVNYNKSKYFNEIFPHLESIYNKNHTHISDFNKEFIILISNKLGLNTSFEASSEINSKDERLSNLSGNELVKEICISMKATQYISGEGCLDFIKPEDFKRNGIKFYFQNFKHPFYSQIKSSKFIENLSIIDVIFNLGLKKTAYLIQENNLKEF